MKVTVMSQENALKYSKIAKKDLIVVSIVGEKENPVVFDGDKVTDIFRMYFEDIERPYGLSKMPSREDFNGLKDFLDKNIDSVEEVVVHCYAGSSRSSACAVAIMRYLSEDDSFIWSSSDYVPNKLVLTHAIDELGVDLDESEIKALYDINDEAHMMCSEFVFDEER